MTTAAHYSRCPRNIYDDCLLAEAVMFERALPFQECCVPAPWQEMPASGQRFQRRGAIALPAGAGVDTAVVSWRVPPVWDGVIITVTNVFSPTPGGAGLVEGSGWLTWRLQDNYRYLRDLGNIQISLGTLRHPFELDGAGYRIFPNDLLTYTVSVSAAGIANLDPNGRVICAITGWLYPHAEYRRSARPEEQG